MKKTEYVSLMAGILFRPVWSFRAMKRYRKDIFFWIPFAAALAVSLIYVISLSLFHFPLSVMDIRKSNFLLEVLKIFSVVISWDIAGYVMSSINDGEMTFTEFSCAAAYSLLPLVIVLPPMAALSHIMSANEAGFFDSIMGLTVAWCVILMIVSLGILNSYSFKSTVKVLLLSLFCMAVMWFIAFVLYAMASQMLGFFKSVYDEVFMLIDFGR